MELHDGADVIILEGARRGRGLGEAVPARFIGCLGYLDEAEPDCDGEVYVDVPELDEGTYVLPQYVRLAGEVSEPEAEPETKDCCTLKGEQPEPTPAPVVVRSSDLLLAYARLERRLGTTAGVKIHASDLLALHGLLLSFVLELGIPVEG